MDVPTPYYIEVIYVVSISYYTLKKKKKKVSSQTDITKLAKEGENFDPIWTPCLRMNRE